MHRRLLFFILLLWGTCLGAVAQKKAIAQARTFIKSGKNLDKAEKLMDQLLEDSIYRNNEKVWLTLADALRRQYEQGNEKLYLKQQVDTASLFTTAKKMFLVIEGLDSLDAKPDEKGRVKLKYRTRNAEYLNTYRPNLYNAGSFFLRKGQFLKAFEFYDTYIDCARQPLFSEYNYSQRDSMMPQAAFWATYAGYKMRDAEKTIKFSDIAMLDTARLDNVTQYLAETYWMLNDTAAYINQLKKGFEHQPKHTFFFPHLVDIYNATGMADSANVVIDSALASDSLCTLFLFAKSSALLNAGEYDQCIDVTQRLIAIDDSLAEAYCNMGLAYYNQALEMEQSLPRSKKKRTQVRAYYEKSRPYMEKYRDMAPTQQAKWVPPLYTIYLNLNMGEEFEEIDKLIKDGHLKSSQ